MHQKASPGKTSPAQKEQALTSFKRRLQKKFRQTISQGLPSHAIAELLEIVSKAWFQSKAGQSPVTWNDKALSAARQAIVKYEQSIEEDNLLPFLFELEGMTSHITLNDNRSIFARGVFAGNFIEVSMMPLVSINATEFCVEERLLDETINLTSRGFAPVIINEYNLVADGNHRLTASHLWNILKFAQDLDWCLENGDFQKRVASYPEAVKKGLLKQDGRLNSISLHQCLSHLARYLSRPDWRARLVSHIKPLLRKHDFIDELPVVVLPEYSSGAVVKSLYDEGIARQRACPSIYEALWKDENLVLPPRASYHFTDSALLPWFTVLKTGCGTKRRTPVHIPHHTGTGQKHRRIKG
jgi:hypothetical protein